MSARDSSGRTVLVVGSGIGGLAVTIALQRAGINTLLFERVSELRKVQVGAGLLIENNAMLALQRLGMAEPVEAAGAIVDRAEHRAPNGKVLAVWPIADLSRRLRAPVVAVSRMALHRTLAGSALLALAFRVRHAVTVLKDARIRPALRRFAAFSACLDALALRAALVPYVAILKRIAT